MYVDADMDEVNDNGFIGDVDQCDIDFQVQGQLVEAGRPY